MIKSKHKKLHYRKKRLEKIISLRLLMLTEIAYCVDNIIIKIRLIRNNYNEQYLHEIRISLRELISLINFFKELIKNNKLKRVKVTLHDLIDPTSQVRDYDVAMTNYIYPSFEDKTYNNDIHAFKNQCFHTINNLHKEVIIVLLSKDYMDKLLSLKAWVNEYNWEDSMQLIPNISLATYIMHRLDQRYTRVTRHENKFFMLPRKELHHHRIKLKELRYVIEIFKFYIKDYEKELTKLKRYQDILGDINDTYATEKILQDKNIFGVAPLHHREINKLILKKRKSYLKRLKNKI